MAKFVSRPTLVEAYQFRTAAPLHTQPGVGRGREPGGTDFFYVCTAHGQQTTVQDGDWIVAEPDGRGYYPVKDDIFRARYTPLVGLPPPPVTSDPDPIIDRMRQAEGQYPGATGTDADPGFSG